MLRAFALLLLCQLAGEALAKGLGLPVPGPVIGLVLLTGGLLAASRLRLYRAKELETTSLGRTSTTLLSHLSLLFVPAGVGIVQHGETLARNGVALILALLFSTVLTLVVTAWVFRAVSRAVGAGENDR
jgi:putative effector of murein hydrolase LrgA (UPF0299 family)